MCPCSGRCADHPVIIDVRRHRHGNSIACWTSMASATALYLTVALLAAALHAANAATAATETPLVLQAEHQDVNATLTAGGAKV